MAITNLKELVQALNTDAVGITQNKAVSTNSGSLRVNPLEHNHFNKYCMKRLITLLVLSFALTGCASITSLIPSFWDPNQSARITDVRFKADSINCEQAQLPQAQALQADLRWFELYSESKGSRQQDVIKIIAPMQESVSDWVKRSQDAQGSKTYCEIKKKLLQTQAKSAAQAIQGRF